MTLPFSRCAKRVFPLAVLLVLPMPAHAQQPSRQERDLTKRVGQLYQFFVSGEWRKVEPFLTEDSKDIWESQGKKRIESFQIQEVKIAPGGKEADVTVQVTFRVPQAFEASFTQPHRTQWFYQKRKWLMQLQPPISPLEMFKMMGAPPQSGSAPLPLVFEQNPVQLASSDAAAEITAKVPFQNVAPAAITVMDLQTNCPCLTAEMDKVLLQPNEKGVLTITYRPSPGSTPSTPPAVQATLAPWMQRLELPVIVTESEPRP